jgi:ClpP class serine protease
LQGWRCDLPLLRKEGLTTMRYKEQLLINKQALDDECVRSGALYDEWASAEAEANEERDDAKAYSDLVRAEVELEVRGMKVEEINSKYSLKLSSITESTIKSIVSIDARVLEAQQLYAGIRTKAAKLRVAVDSFSKRHDALQNLVKLHGQGYFSQVQGKEEKKFAFDAMRREFARSFKASKDKDDDIRY